MPEITTEINIDTEKYDSPSKPEVFKVLFKFLIDSGGSATNKDCLAHLTQKLNFSPEAYPKGKLKWKTALQFRMIRYVEVGLLRRKSGIWSITDKGRNASTLTAEELEQTTRVAYRNLRGEKRDSQVSTHRFWKISPGVGGTSWDLCKEGGFIGYDWEEIGDISDLGREEIRAKSESISKEEDKDWVSSPNNVIAMRDLPTGSLIVANKANDVVLGIGRVTGPYYFCEESLGHRRPVDWIDVREREIENQPTWSRVRIRRLDEDFVNRILEGDIDEELHTNLLTESKSIWLLSAGHGGNQWQQFTDASEASISFNDYEPEVTNCAGRSREEINNSILRKFPESSHTMNALALFEFANKIEIGDVIIAKGGQHSVLGIGIAAGEYAFKAELDDYKHTLSVNWLSTASYEVEKNFPTKTLTNVTRYTFPINVIKQSPDVDILESKLPDWILKRLSTSETDHDPVAYVTRDCFVGSAEVERIIRLLDRKSNLILQGAPGTGKTFLARRLAKGIVGEENLDQVEFVQFHQSYGYEEFVEGFRPTADGNFELREGVFTKFCRRAAAQPDLPFVFVIDEINRGNLSRIFGELMVLLEGDKRSSEHAMPLAYSGTKEDPFFIPSNILVLGLMNTADRSLAMVDFALRRRFAFFNLKPRYSSEKFRSHLEDTGISKQLSDRIISMMTKLNNFIAERQDLGSGFEIGHSFFCPGENAILDEDEWFKDIVELEISPLLDEYCIGRQQTRNELEEVLRQYC